MYSIKGYWEIKDLSKSKFSGTLTIDKDIILEAFVEEGIFSMHNFFNIVHGTKTIKGDITLFDSNNLGNSLSVRNQMTEIKLSPYEAIIGISLDNKDEERFNEVRFELDNLSDWIDLNLKGNHLYNDKNKSHSIKLTPKYKEEIVDFDDFSIIFRKTFILRDLVPGTTKFNINTAAGISFKYKHNISLNRIQDDLRNFQRFFSYLCNHPQYPKNITLIRGDIETDYPPDKTIFYFSKDYLNKSRENKNKSFLIKYKDLKSNFKKVYINWCLLENDRRDILDLFLFHLFAKSIVLDNQFFNLISLLDNYLTDFKSPIVPKDSFKSALDNFIKELKKAGAKSDELEDIKSTLQQGNQSTFKQRLIRFFDKNTSIRDHFVYNFISAKKVSYDLFGFIKCCTDFRNDIAHGRIVKNHEDMVEVINRLYFVNSYIILTLLGYSKRKSFDIVTAHQKRSRAYFY